MDKIHPLKALNARAENNRMQEQLDVLSALSKKKIENSCWCEINGSPSF